MWISFGYAWEKRRQQSFDLKILGTEYWRENLSNIQLFELSGSSGLDGTLCNKKWRNPNGNVHVPYLNRNDSNRNLNLNWFEGDWNPNWRFAARKYFHQDISANRWASYRSHWVWGWYPHIVHGRRTSPPRQLRSKIWECPGLKYKHQFWPCGFLYEKSRLNMNHLVNPKTCYQSECRWYSEHSLEYAD